MAQMTRGRLVALAGVWIAAHVVLAALLPLTQLAPFGLAPGSRVRDQLPVALSFWGAFALAMQAPFLLPRASGWRRWLLWMVISGGLVWLHMMAFTPFFVGLTFALCGHFLSVPVCAGAYLLVMLSTVGLLVGVIQWLLLRGVATHAGWLPFAQLLGGMVLTWVWVTLRYDSGVLPPDLQRSLLPSALAGGAYALIVLVAVVGVRPKRGTVSSDPLSQSATLETPDHDHRSAAGPP